MHVLTFLILPFNATLSQQHSSADKIEKMLLLYVRCARRLCGDQSSVAPDDFIIQAVHPRCCGCFCHIPVEVVTADHWYAETTDDRVTYPIQKGSVDCETWRTIWTTGFSARLGYRGHFLLDITVCWLYYKNAECVLFAISHN